MSARGVMVAALRWVAWPVWRGLRWRIDVIAIERSDAVGARLREELAQARREFGAARRNLRRDLDEMRGAVDRMGAVVAALEERVGGLERPAAGTGQGGEPLPAEARDLLEEVRAEHARVRARITAAALYEERIGRLESSVFTPEPAE